MARCERISKRAGTLAAALLVAACGGGGDEGDINPHAPASQALSASDPDAFLLFPNPLVQADASLQSDSIAYARAYYAAIDPTNAKDTFAKWKAANGFDSGSGTQVSVVFGDVRDLGYGRRMTVRRNADGTVAAFVENFLVQAAVDYAYSTVNLDAALVDDRRWHDGTSAAEFSPGPGGGVSFAKFFNFDAATGDRDLAVELDGRGDKAVPGPCISCHGGRVDPLTPTGLFPVLANSASGARGDVQGKLQPLEVDHLDFPSTAPYRRQDQEAALKLINQIVLCTYPLDVGEVDGTAGFCARRASNTNEWRGSAASLIKNAYGGDALPSATYLDTLIPAGWVGQESLYANVVAPACRACHLVRGYGTQSDIDFGTFAKFQGYAARTRVHVLDRGNMPLAKIVFADFWASAQRVAQLGAFLDGQGLAVRDATGAVLRPGRPVAMPGPDRVVLPGATILNAAGSLYASRFQWSIVSGPPGGATLSNADSAQPTFNAATDGTYGLRLTASSGGLDSAPASLTLVVDSTLSPAPAAIAFSNIRGVLQAPACVGCHTGTFAPMEFGSIDRNASGSVDAIDDAWFYAELRGRINFTDLAASPLLLKPSGNHHRGGLGGGFDASLAPGQAGRANYDLFLNWVLNGAPQ